MELEKFREDVIRPLVRTAKKVLLFMEKLKNVRDKPLSSVLQIEFGRKLFDNILQAGEEEIMKENGGVSPRKVMDVLFGVAVDLAEVAEAKRYGFLGRVKLKNTTYYAGKRSLIDYGPYGTRREHPIDVYGLAYLYEQFLKTIVEYGEQILEEPIQVNDVEIIEYIDLTDNFKLLLDDIRKINKIILENLIPARNLFSFKILAIPFTPYVYLKEKIDNLDELIKVLGCKEVYKPPVGEKAEDYKILDYEKNGIGNLLLNFIRRVLGYFSVISAVLLNPAHEISGYSYTYEPTSRQDLERFSNTMGFRNIIREIYWKMLEKVENPLPNVYSWRWRFSDVFDYYKYYPYSAYGYKYEYKSNVGGHYYPFSPSISLTIEEDLFLTFSVGINWERKLKISIYGLLDRLKDFLLKKVITLEFKQDNTTGKWHITIRPFW